jgi:outer membrane protein assembly factor BamB
MDDRKLSEPMPYTFSANTGCWRVKLAHRHADFPRHVEPDVLPWATETDLIYKDMNVLYSRSLLTGALNWMFGPGGSCYDWDRYGSHHHRTAYYPFQSILVQDGVVFTHMFVYGPSLVAVDQNTGRLLWAKGPMAAQAEDEWLDRYQASPAAGRGMIIVPVVHDDIRGRTHISSSADLAAFEPQTGRLLWRTTLARISPLKITQSRYPRKIRILSTTPVVRDGVVYHVTNAGVVGAVDAQTGSIRWLTRYPQRREVLDNFTSLSGVWRNNPPLIRGKRLYVTPVDSHLLLCIDTETGKILWDAGRGSDSGFGNKDGRRSQFPEAWYMCGFTSNGLLCLGGNDLSFLNPETGKLVIGGTGKGLLPGITGEGEDFWWPRGHVHTLPTLTRDGKVCFSMQEWFGEPGPVQGPFNSEYVFDVVSQKLVQQRRWYDPAIFISRFGYANDRPVMKRPVNEEPESFETAMRMSFKRWDVPFEVDIAYDHIVVRYDKAKLSSVLEKEKTLDSMFARAEQARHAGNLKQAIEMYEACKMLLPTEEEDRRRNINLRLYPLYTEMARWGHQSCNYTLLEEACRKMADTATSPEQEIKALLAYAELYEKTGNWRKAGLVLRNASRHFWTEPISVSELEYGDREYLMKLALQGIEKLFGEIPELYRMDAEQILAGEKAALGDYWLSIANVDANLVVETRAMVAKRIRELSQKLPEDAKKVYEKEAEEEMKTYETWDEGIRLLWSWSGSSAGLRLLKELEKKIGSETKAFDKQRRIWILADVGRECGYGENCVSGWRKGLAKEELPSDMEIGDGFVEVEEGNDDPEMVRLALRQEGEVKNTAHLLFVGERKKRAYGNRFSVSCWNMKEKKKEWVSQDILLGGKTMGEEGYEVGFEKIIIVGDKAIVHGRYDVIALDWRGTNKDSSGKLQKLWHFKVPMGFEIQATGVYGDVIVLCGRGSTLGLWVQSGEILWQESEAGEYYAGPFFSDDEVITVRKSPSEVSFRRVSTGRLLCRLRLPGLTTNRSHPVYAGEGGSQNPAAAEAAEAYPVGFGSGVVVVTDGRNYHVVDIKKKNIRWTQPATKLDFSRDPSYRFWVHGERLFVLKPYYSVLENCVFDLKTGDMLWRRREGGKKVEEKLKGREDASTAAEGTKATGLVLSSMVFVGGKVYGIKYEMGGGSVILVGMDPDTGNELMRVEQKGYSDPEAYVEQSWSKNCVVVRIQDGNKFELWHVDVGSGKMIHRLQLEGYGRLGEYGDVSAIWQGPYLGLWAYEKRKYLTPK